MTSEERLVWRIWSRALQKRGVRPIAVWLLEATSPLHFIGAQLVYVGQPLLDVFWPRGQAKSFAELLEQPEKTKAFVHFLREDGSL